MHKPAQKIRTRALNLLARREHSYRELYQKLIRAESDPQEINDVLADLVTNHSLSDERFAQSYLRVRAEKGFGPERIRAELLQRGVSIDLVEACLQTEKKLWVKRGKKLKQKKFTVTEEANQLDAKTRAKQMRFFYSRGFSAEQIQQIFEQDYEEIEYTYDER